MIDVCILINSTPKYYYILPFMVTMLRRYAPDCKWPIIIATEEPENPIIKGLGIRILELQKEQAGFLESRRTALAGLVGEFKYCLPLQDDFILEKGLDAKAIQDILGAMDDDDDVVSARLMPCPGPKGSLTYKLVDWKYLEPTIDLYGFTFQATLWKTYACYEWYNQICNRLYTKIEPNTQETGIEIRTNLAENEEGQGIFWQMSQRLGYKHIAWIRKGIWPNAVYLSPFPYRPTAIVRGALEGWAKDLMGREGH